MPRKQPLMKLSPDEERFLRHWMFDEIHYQGAPGPAKRLQLKHRVVAADLALLIAATIPDAADQEQAGVGPPPVEPPTWPWSEDLWAKRISAARAALARALPPAAEALESGLNSPLKQPHSPGR